MDRDQVSMIDAHPRSSRAALNAIIDSYLTTYHRDHPEHGCASSALAADAGRHGIPAQEEYRRGLQGYLAAITELLQASARQTNTKLDPRRAREQAIALFSQLVGAQLGADAWSALWNGDEAHDVQETGMLSAVVAPLAAAGVPVWVASGFDGDLVFVPTDRLADVRGVLQAAGHEVRQ